MILGTQKSVTEKYSLITINKELPIGANNNNKNPPKRKPFPEDGQLLQKRRMTIINGETENLSLRKMSIPPQIILKLNEVQSFSIYFFFFMMM